MQPKLLSPLDDKRSEQDFEIMEVQGKIYELETKKKAIEEQIGDLSLYLNMLQDRAGAAME